jgi:N4-gp56 family major capsid protein
MATNYNTNGDLDQRTAVYAAKRLLKRAQEKMILERFGQKDPQPQNKGKTRTYRRYHSLAALPATAPLAEGITPTAKKLTFSDVSVTLETYGDLIELTREVKLYHEDPVFKETMDILGEQQAEVVELIRWNALKGGTNVYYANGVTSRATVNSPAKVSDLKKIERGFMKNKATKMERIIKASADVSTEPIQAAFILLGHTDCKADLENMPGWVPVANYSNSMKAMPCEVGSIGAFRVLLSSLFSPWETSGASGTTYLSGGEEVSVAAQADVYPLIAIAKDAYAIVPLQGRGATKPVVLQPKPAPGDPMGRKGSASWTADQACVILTQTFVARLEVAASAVPPGGE